MKFLFKRVLLLSILTLVLGLCQWVVMYGAEIQLFYATTEVYVFHFVASLLIIVVMCFFYDRNKKQVWYVFLASSVLRILFSIIFFVPLIKSNFLNKGPDVLAFMVPYFVFLLFVVQSASQLMDDEKYPFGK